MSTLELILNFGVVGVLLPLALNSLITRRPPPEGMLFGKLYRAEALLQPVSDVFLVSLCLTCLVRLGAHYGLLAGELHRNAETVTNVVFFVLMLAYLAVLARAVLKWRRAVRSGA